MQKFLHTVLEGKVLVSDGAWGTFLHKKGLAMGECPESWNTSHRADVLDIAKSYVAAGANMVETNSFGANRIKLTHYNLADNAYVFNKEAAAISREAIGTTGFVLGSIGPTGAMLITGDVTEEELYTAFAEQAKGLADGGADAAILETFTALDEATIAIKAVKENTNLTIIVTFSFEKTVDNTYKTMMGVSPEEMTRECIQAGAHIVGTNCGNGMERMIEIVKEIRATNTTIPILVHANAGMPIVQDGKTIFPETPEQMAALVPKLISAGANIIGGCCGTAPEHINAIAQAVRKN